MARRFFYVSLGILALAIAYGIGARNSQAQGTGAFVSVTAGPTSNLVWAVTDGGDLYRKEAEYWYYEGNFFVETGGPVPVEGSSFGAVKGSYK